MKKEMARTTIYIEKETLDRAWGLLKERDLNVSRYVQLCLAEFVASVDGQPVQKPVGQMSVDEFLEVTKYWMEKAKEVD